MSRVTIYLILNKQTNEKYIGDTTLAMNKEWAHHIDRSKRMSSEALHKAFRQYGVHNFMIRELDECEEHEKDDRINTWLNKYNPEYNQIKVIEAPIIEKVPEKPVIEKPKHKVSSPHLIPWNDSIRGDGKHFGLKIRGKNLETGLCTDYESVRVAAAQVTGNPKNSSNILLAARMYRVAYGHRWQLLEEKKKKKAVFGVNKKTEQIEVRYESMAAALRAFECTDKHGILKSLKNPGRYSWKGYLWYYG